MRFFTQLVRTTFRLQLTYRTAMWAGLATNLFFGILRAAVILALYGDQKVVNGLSIGGAITFVGLTQALIAFTTIFGSSDVMRSVYSGDISTDLLRPMNFYIYWLARDLGGSLVNLLGRGLLFMAAFALLYPIYSPETGQQWLGFAAALVLSWLASFSWRFLVNLAAFWTPDAAGIGRGLFGLAQILSGFFIPLRLLPDWFSRFCAFTPFPAMMNTPVEIYLGTISGSGVLQALAFQTIWVLVLFLLGQLFFSVGVKRLVVQGG